MQDIPVPHPAPPPPTLALAPAADQSPPRPADGGPVVLTDPLSIQDACLRLAVQARRELLIFSRDLDPRLYDRQPFLDAVQQLALARPAWPVRVLLFEPRAAVVAGNRLIALSQRLPSRIAIRRVAEDFRTRVDAFIIADAEGYCLRRRADRHEALVDPHAPAEARRLRADFEQVWEQSDEDAELRHLRL